MYDIMKQIGIPKTGHKLCSVCGQVYGSMSKSITLTAVDSYKVQVLHEPMQEISICSECIEQMQK